MVGRETIWVDSLVGVRVAAVSSNWLTEFYIDEQLDQTEMLSFNIPVGAPKTEFLVEDVEIQWRDRRFKIRQAEKRRSGAEAFYNIEADALWYELGEDTIPGAMFPVPTASDPATAVGDPTNVLGGAQTIVRGSRWTAEATPHSAERYILDEQDLTRLALLRRWATVTNRHLRFDTINHVVHLNTASGAESNASFRYGRNLESILRRSTPPEVTVLYPYGRDGLSIAGLNGGVPYLEDFTYYTSQGIDLDGVGPDGRTHRERFTKRRVWREDRFVIDTNLYDAAIDQMAEFAQTRVAYECKVIDLASIVGFDDAYGLRVGDTARVWDGILDVDLRTTVVRLKTYPTEPHRNEIELSSLPEKTGDTSSPGRSISSMSWLMFKHDNSSEYRLRNDGSYTLNRIGLSFREGGEAVFGYDLYAKGVGTGSLSVSALDSESNTLLHPVLTVPYVDDETIHENLTWAMKDMVGQYGVRIRAIATATGGPASAEGVDILEEQSRLWVLAYGAVQQTPSVANSQTFNYTGAVQQFIVPDNVTQITIDASGAQGLFGALAGQTVATFEVVPGTVYDVYVGGEPSSIAGGWPNGGNGGVAPINSGGGGGGSSDVRPEGAGITDALVVAGAGGGMGGNIVGTPTNQGGAGGFFVGDDANSANGGFGHGATQFAGGAPGADFGGGLGSAGSLGQGGEGADEGNAFSAASGGGGGGWYGGGGGSQPGTGSGTRGGGGGGGSGWVHPDGVDVTFESGVRSGNGVVIISWEDPV